MDSNRRELLAVGLVLAVLGAGAYAWWRHANPEPPDCQICRRPIHRPTAFSLVVDGRRIWACCPRCGLECAGTARPEGARATDFVSGEVLPADRCAYVVGSDLTPCSAPAVLTDRDKVTCERCFDRCTPSAIAFREPAAALAFSRAHGGKVVSFDELAREARPR